MTITKSYNFEGGTQGVSVLQSDTGSGTSFNLVVAGTGSTITYAVAAALHGSLGCQVACAAGQQSVVRWTGFNDTTGVMRLQMQHSLTALPGGSTTQFFAAYTAAGALVCYVSWNAAGQVIVGDSAAPLFTSTAAIPSGAGAASMRYELSWTVGTTTSNGQLTFGYYTGDATNPVQALFTTGAANLGTVNWDRAQALKISTSAYAGTFYVDDLSVASGTTQFFGPVPANVAPSVNANAGTGPTRVALGSTVTFAGTASDSDGVVASTAWTQVGGPATVAITNPGSLTTANVTPTIPGRYTFQLAATDNSGAVSTSNVSYSFYGSSHVPATTVTTQGAWTAGGGAASAGAAETDALESTYGISPNSPDGSVGISETAYFYDTIATPGQTAPIYIEWPLDGVNASVRTAIFKLRAAGVLISTSPPVNVADGSGQTPGAGGYVIPTLIYTFPAADIGTKIDQTNGNQISVDMLPTASI